MKYSLFGKRVSFISAFLGVTVLVIGGFFVFSNTALADDTGFLSPTSSASVDGQSTWTTPNNGLGLNDGQYAVADKGNEYVQYNFDISQIPANSTINGVEVDVSGFTPDGGGQALVFLYNNNTVAEPKQAIFTNAHTTIILGGPAELWKTDTNASFWTPGQLALKLQSLNGTIFLDSIQVKIYYTIPVTSVKIDHKVYTISAGNSFWLTPQVIPSNASNQNVTWSSSYPNIASIATVENNGHVTAIAAGTTTITATTEDGIKTDSYILTVNNNTVVNPTIVWSTPADITYGTPLSATQLNATALDGSSTVAGAFNYGLNSGSGTILPVGQNQILTVTFIPTDRSNYNNVNATTSINVKVAAVPDTIAPVTPVVTAGVSHSSGGGGGFLPVTGQVLGATTSNLPTTGLVLGASTFQFTNYLRQGASSDDVKQLQERLRTEGYFTFPTSTGYFGSITLAAVKAYQGAHGIPATGYVGPLTIAALNAAPVVANSVCPNGNTLASNCTSK